MAKFIFLLISICFVSAQALDMEKLKAELQKRAEEHKAKTQQNQAQAATTEQVPAATVCDASLRFGVCYAFTGSENASEKVSKGNEMACKLMRGKMAAASKCPENKLLGRCKVLGEQPKEYVLHYYSSGKMNKNKAEADCTNPKSGLHAQGAGRWF
jgi:hypothetical protein